MSERVDVLVVGGGVAGLSCALTAQRAGRRAALLEGSERLGGLVRTERVETEHGRWVLDLGPDGVVASKPGARALAQRVGLGAHWIETVARNRRLYVAHRGGLHALPEGLQLVTPTRALPLLRTPLLSWRGKARALVEPLVPRGALLERAGRDESLRSFVARRLGDELAELLADSLLAGIFSGDADALSVHATFPQLAALEREHGSLVRGALASLREKGLARVRVGPPPSAFVSFPEGMYALVEAALGALAPGSVHTGAAVVRLERTEVRTWRAHTRTGRVFEAPQLVLAVPPPASAALVEPHEAEAAALLREIPLASSAAVLLGYPRAALAHPLDASGFVVPRREGGAVTAMTFLSEKWAGRAPAGYALLRVFFGGARAPEVAYEDDDALRARAVSAAAQYLGATGAPVLARVARWLRSNPQPVLGHGARIERVRARLDALGGVQVTGAGYEGVGIPDCAAQGARAAERALAALGG